MIEARPSVRVRPGGCSSVPEPSVLAEARFGVERAAELMAEGEAMTTDDLVAALAASPPPGAPLAATPEREPAAEA